MSHSRAKREPRAVFLFLSLVSCCSYYECACAAVQASEQQYPTPSDAQQLLQQQAAAAAAAAAAVEAGIPRSLRKSTPVTSNVLPTMSLLAVASELPASMCSWHRRAAVSP